ncbi:uncharacterized protein LOC118467221 isoform X2 [Anopheles albimanus]|uniref:uncharacterized protein LOC118467221 isoform X2 n=1 Tax=Anopheles albimanus TaxID=7167 RepID=UPI00164075E7|nr:uncharacterized protein LOC118467221 isoform X2 [Anopheles albimanus]
MRNMDNHEQQQQIPLQRLNTFEENQRRQELRIVFEKYDSNGNGYLSRSELRRLIREHKCPDIPKEVVRVVLTNSDENNDGRLDFEEFYKLSTEHPYIFRDFCIRYCRAVVPRRTPIIGDETDGEYESSMKLWPPPLTMIIFSIMEVIFFVVDIVKTDNQNGTSTHGPMASSFIYNPNLRYEVWRFLTYMFVHIGTTLPWRGPGIGTLLVASNVSLSGGRGGRIYGYVALHSASFPSRCIWRCLCADHCPYRHYHHELEPDGICHRAAVCVFGVLHHGPRNLYLQQHSRSVRQSWLRSTCQRSTGRIPGGYWSATQPEGGTMGTQALVVCRNYLFLAHGCGNHVPFVEP